MSCTSCSSGNGTPSGCRNNGHCKSGGCSKMEVYDWLADVAILENKFNIYEVSFKNGARKGFFKNDKNLEIYTGDLVMVESAIGYDIGRVSLSGELVKIQLKKYGVKDFSEIKNIIRVAREQELEIMNEARSREKETMLQARVLARNLGLDMKLGDVEYQADCKKATFFYTADGRVDFRELIKVLAKEFKVKIEMRQIGARQEAGRVGGIGACGRELCCSTWLTDFKTVNTSAARYQNLSINQTKLSGQCGRLKCCLNYELDTYLDALKYFPEKADSIETEAGTAYLFKTDVLKGLMVYTYKNSGTFYPVPIEQVKKILELNKNGHKPKDLLEIAVIEEKEEIIEFADVVGQISLKSLDKKKNKNKKKKPNRPQGENQVQNLQKPNQERGPKPQTQHQQQVKEQPNAENNQGNGQQQSSNKKKKHWNNNKGNRPPQGPSAS